MRTRQLLQVMDDVLVILVSRYVAHWILAGLGMNMGLGGMGSEEEIVIWNWKTGRVCTVSRFATLVRGCLPLLAHDPS